MKAIREILKERLPGDIYLRAVKNSDEVILKFIYYDEVDESDAIGSAFNWESSKEGGYYWFAVYKKYFLMMDDTLIPKPNK